MPNKNTDNGNSGKNAYIEIYIEENGNILLTPLTEANKSIIEKLSRDRKSHSQEYCG